MALIVLPPHINAILHERIAELESEIAMVETERDRTFREHQSAKQELEQLEHQCNALKAYFETTEESYARIRQRVLRQG